MAEHKTQIMDVPISGKPKKRSTGIVGLNLLLDGGFPGGTIIMLYGTPVSGIDVAAQQFWKVEGEEGSYLITDGDPDIGMVDVSENHPEMFLPQMVGGKIIVDSLSPVIIKYGIDSALQFLKLAREEIRKRNANLMVLVYSGIHSPMEMTRLMRAADIVIEFTHIASQNEVERLLAVQKIRDSAVPGRMLPFTLTDHGIEASTTSRVV
jgi:KaiC/GvpD/RAD55 family RecA-like ATPase